MKNTMKQALEVLKKPWKAGPDGVADAIIALEKALAKQEQGEPVAWQYRNANDDGTWSAWIGCDKRLTESDWREVRPLYTTPQQRPWVGLTAEERWEIIYATERDERITVMELVEAKLRSKNERL